MDYKYPFDVGSNWFNGQRYEGSNPAELYKVLNTLKIQYEEFTFIDLGSGKGRALLIASSLPFKKIIGVEYSRSLHEIAKNNISRFPDVEKKCKEIELICTDAAQFSFPEGPLIVYLYNPFGKPVMKEVFENIQTSFHKYMKRLIVVYKNSEFADVWRNSDFMEETMISKRIAIYDTHSSEKPEKSLSHT